jgi:hypothetical protein
VNDAIPLLKRTLATLVEKLEPQAQGVQLFIPVRDGSPDPDWVELYESGRWSAAKALEFAKYGLASSDPETIAITYCVAESYAKDATGRLVNYYQNMDVQEAAIKRRKKGGDARGAEQSNEAAKRWAPWQARFYELHVTRRVDQAKARAIVRKEMAESGWEVSERAARKWLSKEKIVGTQL